MNFCIDTCLGVWNTSFCVESLLGMVVWFGCGPQWRKNLYRKKCWVLGEMLSSVFKLMFLFWPSRIQLQ